MSTHKKYFYIIPIILLNLIPLYAAYKWGWNVFELIFIYWIENIIIGVIHFIRLSLIQLSYIPFALFFIFNYGVFCALHGTFLLLVFGEEVIKVSDHKGYENFVIYLIEYHHIEYAVMSLILLHIYDWLKATYHLGLGKKSLHGGLMTPYRRIMILQVTLIFGVFLTLALNQPLFGLITLVFLKIGFDIKQAIKDQQKQ